MLRSSLSVLALAIAVFGTAQADVYKYVDAQGRVQYTDKPQTLPAQRLNVRSQKTDTVSVQQRTEAERKQQEQSDAARKNTANQRTDAQSASQTSEADKADRCTKARARYDSYMNSQRLYEPTPDGGRRYLDDSELDAARASAKVSMEELCKGL